MKRKITILCILLLAFSFSAAAAPQPARVSRIGFVSGTGDPQNPGPQIVGFREGLRKLGYVDGKSILIEYRYAEGKVDRIPNFVNELVQLRSMCLSQERQKESAQRSGQRIRSRLL